MALPLMPLDYLLQAKGIQERTASYSKELHVKDGDRKLGQKRTSRVDKETQDVIWKSCRLW